MLTDIKDKEGTDVEIATVVSSDIQEKFFIPVMPRDEAMRQLSGLRQRSLLLPSKI